MLVLDSMLRVSGVDLTVPLRDKCIADLTFKRDESEEGFRGYHYDSATNTLSLPRAYLTRLPDVDARITGRPIQSGILSSQFVPREGQAEVVSQAYKALVARGGGMLLAGCGTGKTIMGTEVAFRLGSPTCIMVHKEFLEQQWVDAIELLLPGTKVGRLRQDQMDTGDDFDFVVASTQSLTHPKRAYPMSFFDSFGTLLLDEVHRYGAEQWNRVLGMFRAKYRLGLTATPRRADGCMPLIHAHIGPTVAELASKALSVRVHFVKLSTAMEKKDYTNVWDGQLNRSKLVSSLGKSESRNKIIADYAVQALTANRKVLVLSDRREQLDTIDALVRQMVEVSTSGFKPDDSEFIGHYVGGKKMNLLATAASKPLVLGTYAMAQEGLNIPELDTLILASPKVDIVQSVGRIVRSQQGKKEPVVVDLVDTGIDVCMGYAKARARIYRSEGFEVVGM